MSNKVKIIIIGSVILIIGFLLFYIQKQKNEIAELNSKNSALVDQKELFDGTIRSMSSYTSKDDVKRIIKESGMDLKTIEKDLKALDSNLKGVQRLVVSSRGFSATDVKSTTVIPGKNTDGSVIELPKIECSDGKTITCPDKYGYLSNKQIYELNEQFNNKTVPFGTVSFSSWKPAPWDVKTYSRTYNVTTVVSITEDGKSNYHNKIIINSNNKNITIPIQSSNFVEIYPKSKFRFNPRLYFGIDGGIIAARIGGLIPDSIGEVTPNFQVSLFSYGKTKLDVDWTFLGIGLGYETLNKSVGFMISPANYNIGKPIPLIENLLLGPTVSIDPKGNFGVLLGLRVGL